MKNTTGIVRHRALVRRVASAAAVAAVVVGGLAVGAGSASAKSAIDIGVRSHSVAVGQSVQVTATGNSDDFGPTPIRLCIDERSGSGAWRQLGCAPAGTFSLDAKAQQRGELQFRAQLFGIFGPHHAVLDRTSGAVDVRVH